MYEELYNPVRTVSPSCLSTWPLVRGLVYTCPGLSQLSDALREGRHRLLTAGELTDSFEFDHFYVPWLSHSLFGDTFY